MNVVEQHKEARDLLSSGMEIQIRNLSLQRPTRRILDILILATTWFGGAGLVLLSSGLNGFFSYLSLIVGVIALVLPLNAALLVMHEGMHNNLCKNRFLNRWCSVLAGIPIFISFTSYQVIHQLHHRFLGQEGDPDEYTNYTKNPKLLWVLHYVRLLVGAPLYVPLIPLVAFRRARAEERLQIINECLFLALLYYAIFTLISIELLFQVWLGPGIIVMALTQIRGLAQHGFTETEDPFLASRNVELPQWLSFYLLHENLHLEHHLFPEIPSYNLPRLRSLLLSRLPRETLETGYGIFLLKFFKATLRRDLSPILSLRGARAQSNDGFTH